jgi:alkyl hydroperoxide reductase subunit AhpC
MAQTKDECVKPAKGPIMPGGEEKLSTAEIQKGVVKVTARVGRQAPDFEASAFLDGGFKNIKLSDYKGKWVVLCFYPGDFTFVWPTELAAVATKRSELEKLGFQVLAMSTDSRFTHKIWQEDELSKMVEGGVTFPMLSDAGGRIGSVYGVYDDDAGVDIRGRFLIDPDGVIQAMEVMTPPVGRNVAELLRQVKAFQHVRETGEATPSGWQPGRPTLKPSPELAGKVWKIWKTDMAFWYEQLSVWEKVEREHPSGRRL